MKTITLAEYRAVAPKDDSWWIDRVGVGWYVALKGNDVESVAKAGKSAHQKSVVDRFMAESRAQGLDVREIVRNAPSRPAAKRKAKKNPPRAKKPVAAKRRRTSAR